MLVNHGLTVEQKRDSGRRQREQEDGRRNQERDFRPQGSPAHGRVSGFGVGTRAAPERNVQYAFQAVGQKAQKERGKENRKPLIGNVNQEIRREFRGERGEQSALINPQGQWAGYAPANVEPVQRPAHDGANSPAQKREKKRVQDKAAQGSEAAFPVRVGRGDGNQNVDNAVKYGNRVINAVRQVGEVADHNPRQIAANRGDKDSPRRVQKQRQTRQGDKSCSEHVQRDSREAK